MILKINNVEFFYESTKVLDNIELSVDKGEFLGIMGPNGSGKTTLLRCITRVVKPKTGAVLLENKDISMLSVKEIARSMGVVPQSAGITAEFTAFEIVLMGRIPYMKRFRFESPEDLSVVKEAMEATNTWHLRDRLITELSGGEKQRVMIAKALAQKPKILLLDEPTVHLDIHYQHEILTLIKKLNKEKGITVISVFHDINLATEYCEKLVLLNNGKIVSAGKPEEVLTPENIKNVYNIDAIIKKNPVSGALYVTPYTAAKEKKKSYLKVHIICGGGSGSYLMRALTEDGIVVTAGVLNLLDSDYETAKAFNVTAVLELPFSEITELSYNSNLNMMRDVNAVIVTDFPVGYGNLKNLEVAERAIEFGIPVIIIENTPIQEKDFTDGKATEYFKRLKDKNAIVVQDNESALYILRKLLGYKR
ncbi:MAG: ABC transporter ATP-binding protein [Candidatus Thermoplasmatota archaeon]